MPSTKAKYTPMMTQSISLGCKEPPRSGRTAASVICWCVAWLPPRSTRRVHCLERALVDAQVAGAGGVERQKLACHPVGPAETILQRILAAAAGSLGIEHVILLEQLAALAVGARDVHRPATCDLLGERPVRVRVESGDRDPLQRC